MHHPPSSSWTARHLVRLLVVVVVVVGLAPSSTTVRGFPMVSVPTTRARRTATTIAANSRCRPSPSAPDRDGSSLAYSKKQFEVLTQYRRRSQFHNHYTNKSQSRTTTTTTNKRNPRPLLEASAFWKQSSQESGAGDGSDNDDKKDEDDEERKTTKNLDENNNKEEEKDDDVDDEDNESAATGTTAAATSLEEVAATSTDTETNADAEVEWGSYSSTASTTANNNDDDILVINGMNTKPSAITPTEDKEGNSRSTTTKSLVTLLNDIGNNFKSMAETATTKGTASSEQSKKILCAIQASLYYTLFILYRSYRGFFVLLPALIRGVYQQMNTVMTNNSDTSNLSMVAEEENEQGEDGTTITPATAPSWKTKVTVSLLTVVVTSSYLVGGVLQMATKFIRTIAHTSNVSKSFEAAADEMVDYEARISRVAGSSGDE